MIDNKLLLLYNVINKIIINIIGELSTFMIEFKIFMLGMAENVAVLLSLVMLYNAILPHIKRMSLFNRNLVVGFLFGLIAVLGMMMHIEILPGITQDGRLILVLSAGVIGGPLASIVSGLIASFYRLYMGGAGMLAGIIGIWGSVVIGSLFYHFYSNNISSIRLRQIIPLSLILVINGFVGLLFLPIPFDERLSVIGLIALPEMIFYPLGTVLIIMLVRNEYIKTEAEAERKVFQRAIEQAGDSFIITDKDRNIIYVNPFFEKISGFTLDELYGQNISLFNIPQELVEEISKTVDKEKGWTGNIQSRRKDGTTYEVEASISRIVDNYNNPLNGVIVARDMTEKNRLESRLRQAQKMESMGNLAGGIAHDFNNILGAILGFVDLSLDNSEDGSTVHRYLEQIKIGGNRAKNLVQQILLFSRRSKDLKVPTFIEPIISEVCSLLEATLPSTIEIEKKIDIDKKPVLADSTKIHEVLMNLCINASHAMYEDGTLKIQHEEVEIKDGITGILGTIEPGLYSRILVKDNGKGMSEEVQSQIFDPFYTTKDVGEGTGMGLSVAYGIIQDHGGNILLNSVVGIGTEFQIFLPKTDQAIVIKNKNENVIISGKGRVLLVDDDELLCESTEKMLERMGYHVRKFTSSIEALEAFRSSPEDYDMVITDQTMPKLTGFEMSLEMLDIRPYIPIILTTGYSKYINKEIALKVGIKGFVNKPYSKIDIANAIKEVLDRSD